MSEKELAAEISIEGIVAQRDGLPYIVILLEEKRAQLSVAQARKVAGDIVQLAARTEADAMIYRFFDAQEYPRGAAAAVMMAFRDFRLKLDSEEVEGFHSEPKEGAMSEGRKLAIYERFFDPLLRYTLEEAYAFIETENPELDTEEKRAAFAHKVRQRFPPMKPGEV